ncbi:MAG: ribosomal protein methylthiotransferase [Actinomycetota bacterium]|nr:ribosomal protein methylthiotransferase [Actinomycetota bacterium]
MVSATRSVHLVSLGCARNDVDSEELAARMAESGWTFTDAEDADVTVVNTCGFVDAAKKDSVDALLAAADATPSGRVVAVGCMAERYGRELAEALPEAVVLSFDDYAQIDERLDDVLAGRPLVPHTPRDRRTLLPVTPASRPAAVADVGIPGHAGGPRVLRRRLDDSPVAPLKLASGCDRRCSFCAIPSFRGAFVSRPPAEVLAEARWLAEHGVAEVVLVSENSTSYGKDLGDVRTLERLLPQLAAIDGIRRVRLTYLQPAEMRQSLIDVMTSTPGVVPYFDLSFQHANANVLRRMRRFGDPEQFLDLLARVRDRVPDAGVRSNVIVGFPGETEAELVELEDFLAAARLDVVGVFGYSDEDGTHAAALPDKIDPDEVADREARVGRLVEELLGQRAEERVGSTVDVLVDRVVPVDDEVPDNGSDAEGWADHQGPEVDGTTVLHGIAPAPGTIVRALVVAAEGIDLIAVPTAQLAVASTDGRPDAMRAT